MKLVDLSQNITKQSTGLYIFFLLIIEKVGLKKLWMVYQSSCFYGQLENEKKKNRELEICDAEASDISIIICKGLEQRRKIGKI